MQKKKKDELKKAFRRAYADESIGGNAGENCVGVNTIINEDGDILGFSNYPEDYRGHDKVIIRLNLEHLFKAIRERKTPEYKKPYVKEIFYEGNHYEKKEKIIKRVSEQLKEWGYRFEKE